jgi:hypothetical protein
VGELLNGVSTSLFHERWRMVCLARRVLIVLKLA